MKYLLLFLLIGCSPSSNVELVTDNLKQLVSTPTLPSEKEELMSANNAKNKVKETYKKRKEREELRHNQEVADNWEYVIKQIHVSINNGYSSLELGRMYEENILKLKQLGYTVTETVKKEQTEDGIVEYTTTTISWE